MALLKGKIDFTGKLGDLSAYRMKGIERTVVRAKGGPSAEQIKNDPEFQNVRHNNDEFGGRAKAMSMMTVLLLPQKPLADFNYSNDISSMLKKVQELDTESLWGQRQIEFTKAPALWEGFSMNRKTNFETFARVPIACSLSRETLSAQIDIPALIPGVTLNAPSWRPLYCIQAALGVLPDYLYIPGRKYEPTIPRNEIAAYRLSTDWAASSAGSDAASLQISIPHLVPGTRAFSLMLSIGIRFGTPGVGGTVEQMENAGAAKILAMV
jgi:hypothetical protein